MKRWYVRRIISLPGDARNNTDAEMATLFTDIEVERPVLENVEVMAFFAVCLTAAPQNVVAGTEDMFRRAFPMLDAFGVDVGLEPGGPLGYLGGVVSGADLFGENGRKSADFDLANCIARTEAYGGTVKWIMLDEGIARVIENGRYHTSFHSALSVGLGTVAANNLIRYIAVSPGSIGNKIRVRHVTGGALSVAVTGGILLHDRFNRGSGVTDTINGWGTPNVGTAWTVFSTVGDYSAGSGVGRMKVPAAGQIDYAHTPVAGADQTVYAMVSTPTLPIGNAVQIGVYLRFTDDSNHYRLFANIFPSGEVQADFVKKVAGVVTDFTGASPQGISYLPDMRLRLKASAIGTTISLTIWEDGTPEPTTPTATWTDPDLTAAGDVGCAFSVPAGVTNVPLVGLFTAVSAVSSAGVGDITVTLNTGVSTAAQVIAAVNAHAGASDLVTATVGAGSLDTGAAALFGYTNLIIGDDGLNFTIKESVRECISYMERIHEFRPDIQFVDKISWILWPYNNLAGYDSRPYNTEQAYSYHKPDYKLIWAEYADQLALSVIRSYFIAVFGDNALENFDGLVASGNSAADDWYGRSFLIQAEVEASGYEYGENIVTYWGDDPATDPDHPLEPASNAAHKRRLLEMVNKLVVYRSTNRVNLGRQGWLYQDNFLNFPDANSPSTTEATTDDAYLEVMDLVTLAYLQTGFVDFFLHRLNNETRPWTNAEIQTYVKMAIMSLWPDIGLPVVGDFSTNQEVNRYTLPIGMQRIGRIDLINSSGQYVDEVSNYRLELANGTLVIMKPRLSTGATLRVYGWKPVNNTGSDLPARLEQVVSFKAAAIAYNSLSGELLNSKRQQDLQSPYAGGVAYEQAMQQAAYWDSRFREEVERSQYKVAVGSRAAYR